MKKETIIKFYSNYRLYIFPAIVALSSLFLILFVIYPQTVKLINNQQTIGDLINKSKLIENKVVALESYDEEDLSRKVGFALVTLPADKDLVSILGLLPQLIVQSGFTIESISFGNTANKLGNSDSVEIKLEIRGAKIMFQTLLSNLENSPRLIRVNTIDISAQSSQNMNAAVVVEVLYSLLPQNFGGTDSPLPELSQKDEQLLVRLARTSETVATFSAIESPRGKSNPFD